MRSLLWLDDVRPPPIGWDFTVWSMTAAQAIKALQTAEFDEVSLDHDLGPEGPAGENPGDGYDVLLWIENMVRTQGWIPPVMTVHTDNPPARDRMERAIKAILLA